MAATENREDARLSFDLVRGDLLFRIQRALHLIPAHGGDGIIRRALFFVLLAWLPLVVWAVTTGHAFSSETGEPLLRHFSIHARFLIALPVLILGEKLARSAMNRLLPRFVAMGLVPSESVPAFRKVIAETIRLRNSTLPWITIGGLIVLWGFFDGSGHGTDELNWATQGGKLGFGGWWYLVISRPLFQVIMLGWLWRIVLLTILLKRIVRLGLDPVATHPDKMGGLGFIEGFPKIFAPLAFAASIVLCSRWAHQIAYHGAHVPLFKMQAAVFLVLILLLCLAPMWVFAPVLKKVKRTAVGQYSELIASHGRSVHRKWIVREEPEDAELLEAPELGASADIGTIYDSAVSMRTVPFGKVALIGVLLPAAIPMILVSAMDIPVGELLGKVLKAII